MPRMQKRPYVEPIRRKCEDTQSVKQVQHRYITIPKAWTSKGNKGIHDFTDIPGAVVTNYSSTEGVPEDLREEFINSYDEEQFIRP